MIEEARPGPPKATETQTSKADLLWSVLGAGTAVPHPERSPAGHILHAPQGPILVDMGPGTLWRMAREGLGLSDLKAIVLSHRHLDHFLDLPAMLFASRIPGHGRTLPLEVHVGPGMPRHLERFGQALGQWFEPRGFPVCYVEHVGVESAMVAGATLTFFPVEHDETSIAVRAQSQGRIVAYSGDSDYCSSLVDACRGADVAILECSTASKNKLEGHMSPCEVARIATEAAARRVVLVHTYPELDGVDLAARVAAFGYDGPVEVAADRTRIVLAPAC